MPELISTASALFIFWLFALAAAHKLNPANNEYYSGLFSEFGFANNKMAMIFAKLVGLFELAIALAIILPTSRRMAALFAAALLFLYLLHMAYQLYQGRRDLDCGCTGAAGQLKISGHLLVRNFLLIMVATISFLPIEKAEPGVWLLAVLLAVVAIFVSLSSEQLISNAQKLKTFGA